MATFGLHLAAFLWSLFISGSSAREAEVKVRGSQLSLSGFGGDLWPPFGCLFVVPVREPEVKARLPVVPLGLW